MAEKTLEARISALEAQLGNKTLEQQFREQAELIDRRFADSFREQAELIDRRFADSFREQAELIDRRFADSFREQAELIDRLFIYRFEEFDNRWDAKLEGRLTLLQERVESKFDRADSRLESVQRDVAVIKHAVKAILTRLP